MRGRALRLAGWIERREESSRPAETGGSAGTVRVVEMRQVPVLDMSNSTFSYWYGLLRLSSTSPVSILTEP